jgi:hypothetical protein
VSYDRVLSVKKIPKSDPRYEILARNIAPRDYEVVNNKEWDCIIQFTNQNHIFYMLSTYRRRIQAKFYNLSNT